MAKQNIINKSIRYKRKQEIDELYELVHELCEQDKEKLYQVLKETFNEKEVLDLLYDFLEELMAQDLAKIKKIYRTFDDDKILDLDDLLYHKDGKTLEERVEHWFNTYSEDQLMELFFHLCLILDTEGLQLIISIIQAKTQVEYVEISAGECGMCESMDAEIVNIESIDLPPYHPDCGCHAYFYEAYDLDSDDPTI